MRVTTDTIRVVLVDDQESFRSAARLVIAMADGFELVGEAASGEEGLDVAAALTPDLVLMDINLPGIDGLEATRRIATTRAPTKVIVISTYEAAEYEARSVAAGAAGFLSKADFGPDVLRDLWDRVNGS